LKVIEYGKENKDAVMLLHGGGLSWWNYRKEAELLSDRFHVILPVLDGHAGSDADFESIERNAERIISFIDREYGGSLLLMGGLSLGGQVLTEILSRRGDICRYAIIESASMIPDKVTNALIGPSFSSSYGLIRQKWFASLQFRSLKIREDLFDDYYRDTSAVTRENLIAFTKASTAYSPKEALKETSARVLVTVGGRELKNMIRSAELLHGMLKGSRLEIREGLYHGEFSINCPEAYAGKVLELTGMESQ
jgi:pimeloyl-ACP methyl ester carboxylesterase